MKLHCLKREQLLPISPVEAWGFFSTPANLNEITPPELKFRIVGEPPLEMHEGQIIEYRIQAIPGIWQTWVTEIKHVDAGRCFVDEQRSGPYKLWHHRHTFTPCNGGTRMTDTVFYAMPFGPVGGLAHAAWVKKQVQRIFDYRKHLLEERYGKIELAA